MSRGKRNDFLDAQDAWSRHEQENSYAFYDEAVESETDEWCEEEEEYEDLPLG